MPWFDWFRPPRSLLTFYLAGSLAAAAALGWLGWRLLDQERVIERTRAQERLEIAADRVAGLLHRQLDSLESRLSGGDGGASGNDVVAIAADARSFQTHPPNRLVFYPTVADQAAAPSDVFRAGETVEFAGADPVTAIPIYRALAQSNAPPVRAGALVRLGRCLRKAGRPDEALDVYTDLARLGDTPIEGQPAALAARVARCRVYDETGRRDTLGREARALYHDLAQGRWPLRRAAWDHLMQEARAWAGSTLSPEPGLEAAIALSEAAEALWRRLPELPPDGRTVSWHSGHPVLSLWRATQGRLEAALAGSTHLDAMCRQAAGEAGVQLSLSDASGRIILGPVSGQQATRSAAESLLPWTLHVASADPAGDVALAGTRLRTLAASLVLLAALIFVSGYFTFRGIRRELAVARLQSEFVSAVSHEFRTPLTSLRQLSELLSSGRILSEDRRQQYYDVLTRESERLRRLVEGLLDFERMEAGTARWHFEPLDLAELVEAVADQFQRQSESCRIDLSILAAPCRMKGERDMLSLAVWNLLDNAVKYSPGRGTVWVSVSREADRAAIAVRDEGTGIPRDEQRRVFHKFVRGAGTHVLGVRGCGIGLAIVDRVVRAHGGQVRLESEVGRGSTFTIVVPVIGDPIPNP